MTMSMATKAEGTAAMGRRPRSLPRGVVRKRGRQPGGESPRTKKEMASKRSARVSWRRLSCQKMTATATKSSAEGTTTGTAVNEWRAFAAAHRPRTPGDDGAGHNPGLALRVELRAEKEEQRRQSVEPVVERALQGTSGNPLGERGAQIVKREETPAGGPQQR